MQSGDFETQGRSQRPRHAPSMAQRSVSHTARSPSDGKHVHSVFLVQVLPTLCPYCEAMRASYHRVSSSQQAKSC